jgi:hypothetical protein
LKRAGGEMNRRSRRRRSGHGALGARFRVAAEEERGDAIDLRVGIAIADVDQRARVLAVEQR